jgi:hypothetical protein
MWSFIKKIKESFGPGPVKTSFVGHELIVNPNAPERHKRHISRINTINEALKFVHPASAEAISLQKELKRRNLEMQLEELKGGN